ncbi:hypothetical protein [Myxosarcina sp. GI1]|uniref:hypothetical protein n=1 Tax=Myxosarcina sp. GI1 TaxID=1541065 RepID=UPI00056381CE|nr:hypothetical protein [Myxosarcina sp. GI1]
MCIVAFFVFIRAERINRYKAAIPEELEINGIALQRENNTPLIFALLPSTVRPFSCGGGVFKLSQSTIDAIKLKGLAFFEDATQPRRKKYTYTDTYPAWQETPVPNTWTNNRTWTVNGEWAGLDCINKNTEIIRKNTEASKLPGSYYLDIGYYKIVVLPELGFVTFTFWGITKCLWRSQ